MKKIPFYLLSCLLLSAFCLNAQQLINNKGNRNQSYPVITTAKPEIVDLINQVSPNNIESHIRYMQGFHRVATSPEALTVQNWLVDKFESYGYEDILIHYFTMNGHQLDAGNIVVVKEGREFPNEYILITSHYDHSTFNTPVGPGADDNASGTAGVLECARLLKNIETKRSIMFVPFNAEEFWMVGSLPFAQKCASENMNIIAHFNMDMIGYFPINNPNVIMASGYSHISQSLFEYYQQTANTYVSSVPTIRLTAGDSYGGDHMPFNMYEYPSLYIGDIEFRNPCYHQPCDTIGIGKENAGFNNLNLAKAFVQATLAAAVELANAWLPPQNLSACSGIGKITISWDSSGDNNTYKLFKNDMFIKETTNNFYIDTDVEIGNKYKYYVIAIKDRVESAPSNTDEITFVEPLQLPYSNNFSEDRYGFEQSDWVRKNYGEKSSLCNTATAGYLSENYLSFAEIDWFPIPSNTEKLSIRFKWRGDLYAIWYNTGLFFEVTTDRKTWHKLAYISSRYNNNEWKEHSFSLHQFKNSDFFQARFRLESSGAQNGEYLKLAYITDIEINYTLGVDDAKDPLSYISVFNFYPNPANTYINIETNQNEPYHIAIYDMQGRIIFAQEKFTDGTLNVSHLNRGNYLIVASTKQHRVAKKLVMQ